MFNLVIEYWYFHIKTYFKMFFKQRVLYLLKTISSVYISEDSPEEDIIVFNIPVFFAKKNQINAQGLKNSNCITENLPADCGFSTMKEEVDVVLYHATQIT